MLTPDGSWNWYYDTSQKRLVLNMGSEWQFVTPFTDNQLNPDGLQNLHFCANHAAVFQRHLANLAHLSVTDIELATQIALNLTAAHFFALPVAPKSALFAQQRRRYDVEPYSLVEVISCEEACRCIAIEATQNSVLLMLLEPKMALCNNKTLTQFSLVKVAHDRVIPASFDYQLSHAAA